MSAEGHETTRMLLWLERMQAGDLAARDEILRHVQARLERLTRKMLQSYPRVKRWEETDDVLQNAMLRLLNALKNAPPQSTREFFGLAGLQIRRELLDLVKHYYGPEGEGAHHASIGGQTSDAGPPEKSDHTHEPSGLAAWCEVHDKIKLLPAEEREVFDLLYYDGLTQAEAAVLLNVSVRTVQRRWDASLLSLHDLLQGNWPEL
jgi:RNA polymerase sigma factor (sigma-70 family)